MKTVVETILRRRSARGGFADCAIGRELLEDVLRCGLSAPSSKDARPWRFHVVTDRSLLGELAGMIEAAEDLDRYVPFDPATGMPRQEWASTVVESAAVLRAVPAAIFVENRGVFSSGRQTLVEAAPEALAASLVGYTFEVLGVGAAIENMWIAAVAHGLSGVFMGDVLIAEEKIRGRLSVEGDLVGVLALGRTQVQASSSVREPPALSAPNVYWWTDGRSDD